MAITVVPAIIIFLISTVLEFNAKTGYQSDKSLYCSVIVKVCDILTYESKVKGLLDSEARTKSHIPGVY